MSTPAATIPPVPGMSPGGVPLKRNAPNAPVVAVNLAAAFAAEGVGQSGGKEARPQVRRPVPPPVRRPVPPPFPAMVGLPQGGRQPSPLTLQEITSENMNGMSLERQLSEGGRKKRKSMKKKKTKKRKSMKKKKTKKRKSMKNRK